MQQQSMYERWRLHGHRHRKRVRMPVRLWILRLQLRQVRRVLQQAVQEQRHVRVERQRLRLHLRRLLLGRQLSDLHKRL